MKSSNRKPRYRRRFQAQARSLRPLLRDMAGQRQLPHHNEDELFWRTLFRGLCLKSASECGASPDGLANAVTAARQQFEREDSCNSMAWETLVALAARHR